jgi:hypothetical protein
MKSLTYLLLATFMAQMSWAQGLVWSNNVDGMRARLSLERQTGSPFLKVSIEFQNTANFAGSRKLRFTPSSIEPLVVDEDGHMPDKKVAGAYDAMVPRWEPLLVPFGGDIRFQISFPGMGYFPGDRTIIDLGPSNCWIIPHGQPYFLTGFLTIPKEKGDSPFMDWSGTLVLPKIPIPTN